MQKVMEQIKTEKLAPVYVVHGPETAWHEAVYHALRDRVAASGFGEWNWSVYHGHKDFVVDELITDLATLPWGAGEKVVVLKDAHLIPAEQLERLAQWLEEHEAAGILAVFFAKLDMRLKYAKQFLKLGQEIACQNLQGEELQRYIAAYVHARGKSMARSVVELFVEMVGTELQFIHNELDKLISYAGDRRDITADMVREITSIAPGEAAENAVFTMVDYIAAGDQKAALAALDGLFSAGESPFRILPLIERQLRLLLAAKTRTTSFEDTAKLMGERSAYPLRKAAKYADRFSLEQLYRGFDAVVEADGEMKLGAAGEAILRDLVIRLTVPQKGK